MGPEVAIDDATLDTLAAAQLANGPFVPGVCGARPPPLDVGPLATFAHPSAFDVDSAQTHPALVLASKLVARGGHWEAHEVLEALWHAWGRTTGHARAVQACIKLCAAEVKTRQGRVDGRRSHADGARRIVAPLLSNGGDVKRGGDVGSNVGSNVGGVDVVKLDRMAEQLLADEKYLVEALPLVSQRE